MPTYQFTATDQNGAPQQGTFEAANEEQAYSQLAQYGLTVSQLVPVGVPAEAPAPSVESPKKNKQNKPAKPEKESKPNKEKKKKKKGGLLAIELGGGPNSEDISIFTRQMSTLVHAGLPLLRSLEVMIKQQEKNLNLKQFLKIFLKKFLRVVICRMVWRGTLRSLIICM